MVHRDDKEQDWGAGLSRLHDERICLPQLNSGPVELAFGRNQSIIWVTETLVGKMASFNTLTHSFTEYAPPNAGYLTFPVGIVTDPAGNVWVSEHGGSAVVELVPGNSTFRKFPTSIPPPESVPRFGGSHHSHRFTGQVVVCGAFLKQSRSLGPWIAHICRSSRFLRRNPRILSLTPLMQREIFGSRNSARIKSQRFPGICLPLSKFQHDLPSQVKAGATMQSLLSW